MARNHALAAASSSQTTDRITSQNDAIYDYRYLNPGGKSFYHRMDEKQRARYEDMYNRASTEGSDLWNLHMDNWSQSDQDFLNSLPAVARNNISRAHVGKGGAIFNPDGSRDYNYHYRKQNAAQLVAAHNATMGRLKQSVSRQEAGVDNAERELNTRGGSAAHLNKLRKLIEQRPGGGDYVMRRGTDIRELYDPKSPVGNIFKAVEEAVDSGQSSPKTSITRSYLPLGYVESEMRSPGDIVDEATGEVIFPAIPPPYSTEDRPWWKIW
jgi:hypothetical protein